MGSETGANLPEMPEMVGRDPAAKAGWKIAVNHNPSLVSVKLACDIAEAIRAEVRDTLLYLYGEATEWKEDVDGDCDGGVTRVYVNHDIRISDGLLGELLDLAAVKRAYDESPLQALERLSKETATDGR